MNILSIENSENFYCPVTGQQILNPYEPSSSDAQLFMYMDDGSFEYVHESIFSEIRKNKDGSFNLSYSKLENLVDGMDENIVVYEVDYGGSMTDDTAYIAINLDYVDPKNPEQDPYIKYLPKIEEFKEWIKNNEGSDEAVEDSFTLTIKDKNNKTHNYNLDNDSVHDGYLAIFAFYENLDESYDEISKLDDWGKEKELHNRIMNSTTEDSDEWEWQFSWIKDEMSKIWKDSEVLLFDNKQELGS